MNRSALRRDVMLTALASSLPIGFVDSAAASPLNPDQTIIRQLANCNGSQIRLSRSQA